MSYLDKIVKVGDNYYFGNECLGAHVGIVYSYNPLHEDIKGTLVQVLSKAQAIMKFETVVKQLVDSELQDLADNTHILVGAIDVEEVNKCLAITGYVGRLHERCIDFNYARSIGVEVME